MKKMFVGVFLLVLLAGLAIAQTSGGAAAGRGGMQAPPPTGPIADLANAGVDAINKGDAAFFDAHLAADVVWFDEDGHAIAGKERVLNFVKTKLLAGKKKVTITGLRVGDAWAGYQYTIEAAAPRQGTQTIAYKKVGNDWQIAMVHGAVKAAGHM